MLWKNFPTWFKGLLIGAVSGIAIHHIFYYIYAFGAFWDTGPRGNPLMSISGFISSIPLFFIGESINTISILTHPFSAKTAALLGWLIFGSIIGAITGLIIQKIKAKK